MLVSTDEIKNTLEKYEELWTMIRDLIRSKTDDSDDYDEKYMKIKFNFTGRKSTFPRSWNIIESS